MKELNNVKKEEGRNPMKLKELKHILGSGMYVNIYDDNADRPVLFNDLVYYLKDKKLLESTVRSVLPFDKKTIAIFIDYKE